MKRIKLVGINARYTHSCLALFYVRNELEKNLSGCDCELLQHTINDNYYEMLLRLSQGNPRYIFFSAAIWNSGLIEKLTLDLRSCLPGCRVVIGGPQAAVLGEQLNVMVPDCCTVVLGEIEAIGETFYNDLQMDCLKASYRGTSPTLQDKWYDYPYRSGDFTAHLQNRHIYYESSRGCPFNCTYCLSAGEKGVYHKDLATVEKELSDILSYGPKVVRFIDRTFNDLPERALSIWKFIAANGGQTLFHFEMAPDRFTEEMFAFLENVAIGRFQFELGVQSTNDTTLQAINRRVNPTKAHQNITRLMGFNNIHLHVDLILGLPYETRESFAISFRDIFAMGAHYIQMGLLKILPDTPLCHGVEEFGYLHCSEPPYSILQTKWMDHSTLSELYWFSECVEKFINNRYFVSFWQYLRRHQEDIYSFFNEVTNLCQGSGFFQLAATQELMCTVLVSCIEGRPDRELLLELLRYDWLHCGFRFLPDCLKVESEKEQPEDTKSILYGVLPQELEGVYRKNNRNQFFRKSYFLRISHQALREIDVTASSEHSCLCFLQERENSLYQFNKILKL